MTIRDSYVEHFGEEQATKVEESALTHMRDVSAGHREDSWGSDPFRYHLLACISFDCFTVEKNREYHGITVPLDDVRAWALEHADLHLHDGDIPDFIAFTIGVYYSWIDWDKAGTSPPEHWRDAEAEIQVWRDRSPEEALNEMVKLAEEMIDTMNDHGDFEEEN